jgi:hypothetical protein
VQSAIVKKGFVTFDDRFKDFVRGVQGIDLLDGVI